MISIYKIKVTRINNRYHCRLYREDKIIDETACNLRLDIGYVCREMLRTVDKCGGGDDFTHAARMRNVSGPVGKIFWKILKSDV